MTKAAPVPSEVYTEDYFLSDACEGYGSFSEGRISAIKHKELDLLDAKPGQRVLDLGCGRGEVLAELAGRGVRVVGIDYAAAAVRLARTRTEGVAGVGGILRGDATALPFRPACFDRVLMGDVIEHLPWDMGVGALKEVGRVLAGDGLALVHTSPNRWFSMGLMPMARVVLRLAGKKALADRIGDYQSRRGEMHPNELSPIGLRRLIRQAGLSGSVWVDPDVLRSGASDWTEDLTSSSVARLAGRVGGVRPLRYLIGNDLYARLESAPGRHASHLGIDPTSRARVGPH
ncbi:MAG: class I SAM-dependent methyltransferase [Acidimicrobiales bacterium]